ncbi:16S rRNA (adenine(1518)-N(6)/adenine(1519)-N(6))-dimethyltransferase [bacterium]|jgi:16S rRNA (adenine1518-N6/adenine1519-N6)-dimethyltransferase|nr:16S rRNA (adenine(1518)-N(6)/adenine(1519)-N(6))-dimethyltransferase [bacterium]
MKNQSKRLGQVFLKDNNILDKIVNYADLDSQDKVIEIGCGEGDLTYRLAEKVSLVLVVEIDSRCIESTVNRLLESDVGYVLESRRNVEGIGCSCVELVSESLNKRVLFFLIDFLKVSLKDLLEFSVSANLRIEKNCDAKIVANVPYYISAKIVQKLSKEKTCFQFAVLMFQKEFGEKLKAAPGEKIYTSLTVFSRYHFLVDYGFDVSRRSFFPVPKVDSCVIKFTPRFWSMDNDGFKIDTLENNDKHSDSDINEKLLFNIVQTAFWARRKTFMKCLKTSPFYDFSNDLVVGLPFFKGRESIRGEKLGLSDFFEVYRQLVKGMAGNISL